MASQDPPATGPAKQEGGLCPKHRWRPHRKGGHGPATLQHPLPPSPYRGPSSYLGAVEAQQDVHLQRGHVEDAVSKLHFGMAQPRPLQPPGLRALPAQLALTCQRTASAQGPGASPAGHSHHTPALPPLLAELLWRASAPARPARTPTAATLTPPAEVSKLIQGGAQRR